MIGKHPIYRLFTYHVAYCYRLYLAGYASLREIPSFFPRTGLRKKLQKTPNTSEYSVAKKKLQYGFLSPPFDFPT